MATAPSCALLLLVAMEHGLLLVLALCEYFVARPPQWVRLVTARRQYEMQNKYK